MPTPFEHKAVQARILKYAQEIGWTVVPREEAEARLKAHLCHSLRLRVQKKGVQG